MAASDTITIWEKSGTTQSNMPVQIGRPFVQGEIADYPQVGICTDSTCASVSSWLTTQADVKQHWSDGSVRHAIVSFLVPSISGNATMYLTFRNQTTCNCGSSARTSAGITKASMLANYNFDAIISLVNGSTSATSHAATILNAWDGTSSSVTGPAQLWVEGSIATTLILADHTNTQTCTGANGTFACSLYDMGVSPAARTFRPVYEVTFWNNPQHNFQVRYVGEIANTQGLADQTYQATLTIGSTSPATVYAQPSVWTQNARARWTKSTWYPTSFVPPAIDHNLPYVTSTTLLPNYDPQFRSGGPKPITESTIEANYSTWTSCSHTNFGDDICGDLSNQGGAGYHPEIGPVPSQVAWWLYTMNNNGDTRMHDLAFNEADLYANWHVHLREGDATKNITRDSSTGCPYSCNANGLGLVSSVTDRKTISLIYWPLNSNGPAPGDGVGLAGTLNGPTWWDAADLDGLSTGHLADWYAPLYLLTGDYFYLEEGAFWSGYVVQRYNPAYRGPTGAEGGPDQAAARYQARSLQIQADTAAVLPDGTPERAMIETYIGDWIASEEGFHLFGISGTYASPYANASNPRYNIYNWAATNPTVNQLATINGVVSPLHQWDEVNSGVGTQSTACDPSMDNNGVLLGCFDPWMYDMVAYSLGRSAELGYDSGRLLSWFAAFRNGQFVNPDGSVNTHYNPGLSAQYNGAMTSAITNTWAQTWAQQWSLYNSEYANATYYGDYTPLLVHGMAMTAGDTASAGSAAWSILASQVYNNDSLFYHDEGPGSPYYENPVYAVIPRSLPATTTDPPSAACSVATTALPNGTAGMAYSQALSSSGCTAPIKWTISAGSLCAGLSLASASGAITGTPTAAQTCSFTVQASDSASHIATQPLSITIAASAAALSGLSCAPVSFTGAGSSTCTITLTQAAASAGAVSLSSTSTALTVPASVTVSSGATTASFSAAASVVTSAQTAGITATWNGVSETVAISLNPPPVAISVAALQCTPATLASNAGANCTVTLSGAPAAATSVALAATAPVTVPALASVPANATSATFTAAAGTVTANQTATVTASLGSSSLSTSISLTAPASGSGTSAPSFVSVDTTTQGSWRGVYGGDGYNVIDNAVSYPSYAQVTAYNYATYVWDASTSAIQALQDASGSNRIAACWYSAVSLTVGINITDGNTHQVALYLLDWDSSNQRAETVSILNAATQQVLDTRTVSSFSSGQYLVANVSGNVLFQITRTGGANAVLSGLFFGTSAASAAAPPPPVSVSLTPASGNLSARQTETFTATVANAVNSVSWTISPTVGSIVSTGAVTATYTAPSTVSAVQTVTVTATSTADATKTAVSVITLNPSAPPNSFGPVDTTTQGSWKGVYGADGYNVIGKGASYPSYAKVTASNYTPYTWTVSTSAVQALQDASGSSRIAACWYSGTTITLDINIADGNPHEVALYLLDWDAANRVETVSIVNAATQQVLATQVVSNFAGGQYLVATLSGHVQLQIARTAGVNAVVSGLFFGQ